MQNHITVVGSVNIDLVFRTPRLPAVGETMHGHDFQQIRGGKGANQAVAAARLGAPVKFVGAVGDDGFGEDARRGLSADGIDLSNLVTVANCATGVAGILVQDSGDNSIVLAAGANGRVDVAQIESAADVIGSARIVLAQLETPLASVTRALQIARAAKVEVVMNPAPAQPLSDEVLQLVDYLVVNETEASQLSGTSVVDAASGKLAAQQLLARGVRVVLLTMGEHGVLIAQASGMEAIPAQKVEVVDTTAAGDTFVGAFAVGILSGLSVIEASRQATYAAALTVTKFGAQTSIPTKAEVEQFKSRQ
jgi:ribokinase